MTDSNTPQHDENHLIAERRAKLTGLRSNGVAFPNDFVPTHRADKLHTEFGEQDQATLAAAAHPASVAGRMMLKRVMGKASFATLQDSTGRIQIYSRRAVSGRIFTIPLSSGTLATSLPSQATSSKRTKANYPSTPRKRVYWRSLSALFPTSFMVFPIKSFVIVKDTLISS